MRSASAQRMSSSIKLELIFQSTREPLTLFWIAFPISTTWTGSFRFSGEMQRSAVSVSETHDRKSVRPNDHGIKSNRPRWIKYGWHSRDSGDAGLLCPPKD